ncbi:MAG: flagellar export protein FliJ [Salaquimonas sp.]|nr:flagellar export protein FliJ [Salaquimonas sp.]
MKSRESQLRLKHFQVEDKTRQLTQIDLMIGELSRMAEELDNQIRIEEEKSGITDASHFAYPTFAKAARQRRDNLQVSIRELNERRQAAQEALNEAEEELKKAQLLENRDGASNSEDPVVDEQIERRAMIG